MSCDREEMWADLTQFDTRMADGVWDGEEVDPDAPSWFADLRSLVHRARQPAEPGELADEVVLVDTMRRATLGETLTDLTRRPGVRTIGRLVTLKAAAATTATMMTVAAAAATTGIVATVAANVVMPAIEEHVLPIVGHVDDGDDPAGGTNAVDSGDRPDIDLCSADAGECATSPPADDAGPATTGQVAPGVTLDVDLVESQAGDALGGVETDPAQAVEGQPEATALPPTDAAPVTAAPVTADSPESTDGQGPGQKGGPPDTPAGPPDTPAGPPETATPPAPPDTTPTTPVPSDSSVTGDAGTLGSDSDEADRAGNNTPAEPVVEESADVRVSSATSDDRPGDRWGAYEDDLSLLWQESPTLATDAPGTDGPGDRSRAPAGGSGDRPVSAARSADPATPADPPEVPRATPPWPRPGHTRGV